LLAGCILPGGTQVSQPRPSQSTRVIVSEPAPPRPPSHPVREIKVENKIEEHQLRQENKAEVRAAKEAGLDKEEVKEIRRENKFEEKALKKGNKAEEKALKDALKGK
jgi:hypothetical protein